MDKTLVLMALAAIVLISSIMIDANLEESRHSDYDSILADKGFEALSDEIYDYFSHYNVIFIENTTPELSSYMGKKVILNLSQARIDNKSIYEISDYIDIRFLEHMNKQGLYLLTYGPSMYFAKFNDHNLRQYTETEDGLWDKTYIEYCNEMDNITRLVFYSRLIDISVNGFYYGWDAGLINQEKVLLIDTIGIGLAEEYKARKVNKPSYEQFSGYNNIALAIMILYMNNGGEIVDGKNNCIFFETNYNQHREIRISNEVRLTQEYKEYDNEGFSNLLKEINGKGDNLFQDIIAYIRNPEDYDRSKKESILSFFEFLVKEKGG
ncbi:hypothetical protein H6503_03735 [Candidatus Woesearchaeota archaeon]|nr:hypothetical protein [Candidatus Woesearchaeota archaeon]